MRGRNGGGCDGPRLFRVIAIWTGFVLAQCRGVTVTGQHKACPDPKETPTRDSMSVSGASMRGTEHPYVRTSCACPPTPLNDRSGQGVSPGRDGRVGGMVEMARSQCRSRISYLCVGVSWTDASVV